MLALVSVCCLVVASVAEAACAVADCSSCTTGTYGADCSRRLANRPMLIPELIICMVTILMFVCVWAVFIWFCVYGWDVRKGDIKEGDVEHPLRQVVSHAVGPSLASSPARGYRPQEQFETPRSALKSAENHDRSVASSLSPKIETAREPALRPSPERSYLSREPVAESSRYDHRAFYDPKSPQPQPRRSASQNRRDTSPLRRAPSGVVNPSQPEYRSVDPSTRHSVDGENPYSLELQRNLSPSRTHPSRPVVAPPSETMPGSECPYTNSTRQPSEETRPFEHAHHAHAAVDISRGGVRGPYNEARRGASLRRHEEYVPHDPPADTRKDINGNVRVVGPGGPTRQTSYRGDSGRDNTNSQARSVGASIAYDANRGQTSTQLQYRGVTSVEQRSSPNHNNSPSQSWESPIIGMSPPGPQRNQRDALASRTANQDRFRTQSAQQQQEWARSGHVESALTDLQQPRPNMINTPRNARQMYRGREQGLGNSTERSNMYIPSSLGGAVASGSRRDDEELVRRNATRVGTSPGRSNVVVGQLEINRPQSNPSPPRFTDRRPSPLPVDEVYPNSPRNPNFMNGLGRRSRSRGPGGGRRKSIGLDEDGADDSTNYVTDGKQRNAYAPQQQSYSAPRNSNTYSAYAEKQQGGYLSPNRDTSTRFDNNNNRSRSNYGPAGNRSASVASIGDNPYRRGRMSVFPAPPFTSQAESHYDLPSSRSPSNW